MIAEAVFADVRMVVTGVLLVVGLIKHGACIRIDSGGFGGLTFK